MKFYNKVTSALASTIELNDSLVDEASDKFHQLLNEKDHVKTEYREEPKMSTTERKYNSTEDEDEDIARPYSSTNSGNFFGDLLKLAYVNSGVGSLSHLTRFGLDDLFNRGGDKKNKVDENNKEVIYHVDTKENDNLHHSLSHTPPPKVTIDETLHNHLESLNEAYEEVTKIHPSPDHSLLSPKDSNEIQDYNPNEIESFNSDEQINAVESKDFEIGEPLSSPLSRKKLTTLQASVIENLDPHSIREGVLTKLKEGMRDNLPMESHQQKQYLRVQIANKLQRSFHLSEHEYFLGNYNSWLIKDVLLQGHVYLTSDSLLFFAFLQNKDSQNEESTNVAINDDSLSIIQRGTLGLKTMRYGDTLVSGVLTHRYWAVLRQDTMSIYSSSTELYFPLIVIDIKSCLHVEVSNKQKYEKEAVSPVGRGYAGYGISRQNSGTSTPRDSDDVSSDLRDLLQQEASEETVESSSSHVWIKLVTRKKTYRFQCDSLFVARKWCNNLTKLIFQHNNTNSNSEVLIKIPHSNIIEYNQFAIFSEDQDEEDKIEDEENDIPFGWNVKYYSNNESRSTRLKKKFTGEDESLETESIYFLFPKSGSNFFNEFEKIVQNNQQQVKKEPSSELVRTLSETFKRSKQDDSRKQLGKSISTLTPSLNNLVQSVLNANGMDSDSILSQQSSEKSTAKKFGSTLVNATKIFAPKKSPSVIINESSDDNNDILEPKNEQNNLCLPKNLSIGGLRSLDILLETSIKQMGEAITRYDTSNSAKSQEELFSIISRDSSQRKGGYGPNAITKALTVFGSKLRPIPSHYQSFSENDSYYIKQLKVRERNQTSYRETFALGEDCKLISSYNCYLQRSFPVYGEFFIGETEVCFKSSLPGLSTKMIVPIFDIEAVKKEHGIRLAYSGIKIICKGREEMTLEFNLGSSRTDCYRVLCRQLNYTNDETNDSIDRHIDDSEASSMNGDNYHIPSSLEIARKRIEMARIKMFEDRLTTASGLDIPIMLEDSPFLKTEMKPSASYKITLLTIGSRGDVQPYIALGKGLIKEGHKVRIATHGEFGPWIKNHGLEFKEIAGDPGELMSFMVNHSSMSVSFLKDAQAKFGAWITKLLTTSWEACQGSDILIESPSAMAGIHIAEALVIPYFRAFTMPWTKTRAYPNPFFVPDQKKGGSYNYLTHVLFEAVFWKGISSQVNKWREEELHLPRTNLYRLQQSRVPFLYNVSLCILPPAVDFPDWVKVTGYWFLNEGYGDYQPPSDLVGFMRKASEDKKKVIYVGFGSIVVKDAKSLTKAVVEAVVKADVRCILNKGWSDRLSNDKNEIEIELPKEIFNSGNIPHDWLFPRIDAAIHHGGSGTTGATVRAGCPSIIKPFFGDQFFYATQIEDLGVGLSLKKLTAKSLTKAIVSVTTDSAIIDKCKKLASKMSKEHGVLSAIEAIYSELEYSRNLSLIKDNHNINYKKHNPDFPARVGSPKSDSSGESSLTSDVKNCSFLSFAV